MSNLNTRFLRYEGAIVEVTGDRYVAADWYLKFLGGSLVSESGNLTLIALPGGHMLPLISDLERQGGDVQRVRESTFRLTLETADLSETRDALMTEGVRVTGIASGPGGEYFDFYDLEGNRLTAVGNRELDEEYSESMFVRYGVPRISVRNYASAIAWYVKHLGMRLLAIYPDLGHALMVMNERTPIWIEARPGSEFQGAIDPYVRPFFSTLDLDGTHRYADEAGLTPSGIITPPDYSVAAFHFHDPDGNPVNVWHYPEVADAWNETSKDLPYHYLDPNGKPAVFHPLTSDLPTES